MRPNTGIYIFLLILGFLALLFGIIFLEFRSLFGGIAFILLSLFFLFIDHSAQRQGVAWSPPLQEGEKIKVRILGRNRSMLDRTAKAVSLFAKGEKIKRSTWDISFVLTNKNIYYQTGTISHETISVSDITSISVDKSVPSFELAHKNGGIEYVVCSSDNKINFNKSDEKTKATSELENFIKELKALRNAIKVTYLN